MEYLEKAKLTIMTTPKLAFLGSVLFQLNLKEDNSIPTAATNGRNIMFNREFTEGLSTNEQVFVLLHEVMHVVLEHIPRIGNRDPRKVNIAADYVINDSLKHMGLPIIEGCLWDEKYTRAMTMEEVYDLLPDDPEEMPDHDDLQPEAGDNPEDGEGEGTSPLTREELDKILTSAMAVAPDSSIMEGLPKELLEQVEELKGTKRDWRSEMYKYMDTYVADDYSWNKSRFALRQVAYLPSLHSLGMDTLSTYVDVSSSVPPNMVNNMLNLTNSIKNMINPIKTVVQLFTTSLQERYEAIDGNDVVIHDPQIGGGTDIRPVIEQLLQENPQVCIINTDGYFSMPDLSNVTTDIYWLIYDNPAFVAPKGKVIHMEDI